MNSTKVEAIVQKVLKKITKDIPQFFHILNDIKNFNKDAHVLLVGGAVRDACMGQESSDYDIEVYGIALLDLEKILGAYGVVRKVGKAFGVLKIDGIAIDWALPRTDSSGRKPDVISDPYLSYKQAFARRDLTINAMGIDCVTGEFIDPYNGLQDLEEKRLKVVDSHFFQEDPLRFFRVMQFSARFECMPDQQLYEIGKSMKLDGISQERITQEFYKLCVLGVKPSWGLDWLQKTERLQEYMPEVYALIGIEQNPKWHPEGDVFEHTKQAFDGAALQHYQTIEDRFVMTLTALCHDLGKATTTRFEDGRIRSKGHDIAGVALTQSLLQRLHISKQMHARITKLVRWHMTPYNLIENNAGDAAYKRLAWWLSPETSCAELCRLVEIDKSARNPEKNGPIDLPDTKEMVQKFTDKVTSVGVLHRPIEPLLKGTDLFMWCKQGPNMGKILEKAYELQIEYDITQKDALLHMLEQHKIINKKI